MQPRSSVETSPCSCFRWKEPHSSMQLTWHTAAFYMLKPSQGRGSIFRPRPIPRAAALSWRRRPCNRLGWTGKRAGSFAGFWGCRSSAGAVFRLRPSRPAQWIVASKDASALIVGREDTLHLQSPEACCVSEVSLKDEKGKSLPAEWKTAKPDELEVKVPLQNVVAGSVMMMVKQ